MRSDDQRTMNQSMSLKIALACAFSMVSCSAPAPDIHRVPGLRGGTMVRDFIWRLPSGIVSGFETDTVYYNRAFLVKGVYLDSDCFAERKAPDYEGDSRIYERENIINLFKAGDESYLLIFRNYRRRNLPTSPGSFRIIIRIHDGIPVKGKSIVNTYISGFASDASWFPRHLYFSNDSLDMRAGNNHTRDSIRVRAKIHVDSSFGLDGMQDHYESLKSFW